MIIFRSIPTPSFSQFSLGPLTIHMYALCILLGIVAALLIGRVRWRKAGGIPSELFDLAIYVIPLGIVGGRLYHVVTTPELYFGRNGHFLNAFKVWEGGMGIWGAVAVGALVTYLYFQHSERSISFPVAADVLAPGIALAQAIGRWGNWFNHELFGSPTKLPWALEIPVSDRPVGYENVATFHPTFLYESLWCLGVCLTLLHLPQLKKLRSGNLFLAYVVLYCAGRIWIEALRIDPAHHILGFRLNVWVALICGVAAGGALLMRERSYDEMGRT